MITLNGRLPQDTKISQTYSKSSIYPSVKISKIIYSFIFYLISLQVYRTYLKIGPNLVGPENYRCSRDYL